MDITLQNKRSGTVILIKIISCVFVFFICATAGAQPKRYTVANAHSHNDYLNDKPFYTAYNNGFASIEADVFLIEGKLMVAHSRKEIKPQNTLEKLYIRPLIKELAAKPGRRIKLLIDIKDNYKLSLKTLIEEIQPIVTYLSTAEATRQILILITGNRPPPSEYINYPGYIFFDDDLKKTHNTAEWQRVGLVSLPFVKFTTWKGEGRADKKDLVKLRHTIDSVHTSGKTIRLWAAPDTKRSWKLQKRLGVDLIGTDKIDELGSFLGSGLKPAY